jgi:hypothetical protein
MLSTSRPLSGLVALTLAAAAVTSPRLIAQDPVRGNGVPSAYIENTPGMLGGTLVVGFGSPTTPNSLAVVAVSGSFTPFVYPFAELGGPIALDPLDPGFNFFVFGLDGSGNGSVSVALPPAFLPAAAPPLFAETTTFESPSQWSVSRTTRIDWMTGNTWEQAMTLATARQMHTATALGGGPRDNVTEVLICGGATGSITVPFPLDSAELFSPLLRAVTPLPPLSLPRAGHRAVRLPNGLVLITGGVTTGGLVTATCELFVPGANVFVPAPSMSAPRAGHALTLLDDGRVLVSGGVADYQNTSTDFIAALNTAQDTAEVFDPVANTWSPLPTMASKRLGHSQTKLADGRVLVTSGIFGGYSGQLGGGQVPRYTASCEVFDPATNTFAPTAPLNHLEPVFGTPTAYVGRAYHGATLLPNGRVLLVGGFVAQIAFPGFQNDETFASSFTDSWDPVTGAWTQGPDLPIAVAYHAQEPLGSGVLICGGFSRSLSGSPSLSSLGTTSVLASFDGATFTWLAPIPGFTLPPPGFPGPPTGQRGAHTLTRLCDGTFLVYGGGVWPNTLGDGWIYAPN